MASNKAVYVNTYIALVMAECSEYPELPAVLLRKWLTGLNTVFFDLDASRTEHHRHCWDWTDFLAVDSKD